MTEPRSPGGVVQGFRLEERIHRGSMAEIWRVTRDGAAEPLVMKIPSFRDGSDPAALVGFEVEQMILPTLSGAHVPRFVASGDWSAQPFIVMELIAGASLRPRLDGAPLDPAEVASIGARIAGVVFNRANHADFEKSMSRLSMQRLPSMKAKIRSCTASIGKARSE